MSLLEALTLTPMRCSQFVDVEERTTRIGRGIERLMELTKIFYAAVAGRRVEPSRKVIAGGAGAFRRELSRPSCSLNKEFIPSEDQSRFNVRLKTPVGSSLAYSDTKFSEVEKFLSTAA